MLQRVLPRALLLAATAGSLAAGQPAPSTNAPTEEPNPARGLIRQIMPGVIEIGQVRLNEATRTISFPAVVNLTDTLIEYALVNTHGKTHESLLRTEVEPLHLQLALLLLGATNSTSVASGTSPGSAVSIEIAWKRGWWTKRRNLEELVLNRREKRALNRTPWIYTGSRIVDGGFAAQSSGSIISLIGDPEALINRLGADPADDENWLPFARRIPRLNTRVQVSIRLQTR